MIIENVFFKRDAFLHARVPEEIKKAFQELAKSKGKTVSGYVLELILKELSQEKGNFHPSAVNTKKEHNYGE